MRKNYRLCKNHIGKSHKIYYKWAIAEPEEMRSNMVLNSTMDHNKNSDSKDDFEYHYFRKVVFDFLNRGSRFIKANINVRK